MDRCDHIDRSDALVIVGLHGKMGAGKNEAARRLATLAPVPVVEVSFAAKLKQSAAALLGCSVEALETLKNKPDAFIGLSVAGDFTDRLWPVERHTQTVRSFLQRYGTEAHRDVFGEDFWLDAAMPSGRDYSGAIHVATDVRFANEARRVRQLGGFVVLVVGPHDDTGGHASEQTLGNGYIDLILDNTRRDDDFASLDAQLVSLLNRLSDMREIAA